ncbi:PBP1A family penicillin-binding protein [Melghirimyces algeriensis]|uniref:Penicillin-binding protein 1A/penicillin-binding protein 2A n=1 Tax=Melghirimyces algeriensis TaxID=910412 RepID=A0A521EZF5_9BACL|nr:PBP1A family penicillin-binding protein [Melghirimyces algeriensis]SMO88831.1 penicillin-binding protein 1A/penicillin-binding protein 2A [Melghirimyces algeriensis]
MKSQKLKSYGRLFMKSMMTKKWWLLVLSTSILIIIGGLVAVLMTTSFYELDSLKNMQFATTLHDYKGKKVASLGAEQREFVKLDKVQSKDLAKAFVAVEDERFYEHNGADLKGFARAIAIDIATMSPKEGASTITMQVARNIILQDRDKTFMRKVNEIALAYNLERKYTKEQILEAYLNYIYFGNNVSGIQMASKIYFGKDLTKDKLEPHEIALLAGLPKAPEGYNPYRRPKAAKQRRNVVLKKMAEHDLITEEEKEKYQKMDLGVDKKYYAKYEHKQKYKAYTAYVIEEAEKRYGIKDLANGKYKIYTGLNKKAQLSLEKTLKKDSFYQNHKKLDAGATMIDPKNGLIAAIGGGRHYIGSGFANRALSRIQPGSSIKPLTTYAPAIEEKGYTANTLVSDSPFTYRDWTPKNYDHTYHGTVPLKVVAAKSLNVSTARILTEVVGVDTAYEYAQKLGLKLNSKDRSPAPLALGGLTEGVSTLQMAQAYSSFPNDGKYTQAHTIQKIVNVDGEVVKPKKEVKEKKVFSKNTARIMSQILKYTVDAGTGKNAQLSDGRDVAGKTGTTQNSKEAWFVGYTAEYVMATTVFNENGSEVDLTGGQYPARIFQQVMSDTLKGTKASHFKPPSGKRSGNTGDSFPKNQPESPKKQYENEPEENPDSTTPSDEEGETGTNPGDKETPENPPDGDTSGNPTGGDEENPGDEGSNPDNPTGGEDNSPGNTTGGDEDSSGNNEGDGGDNPTSP